MSLCVWLMGLIFRGFDSATIVHFTSKAFWWLDLDCVKKSNSLKTRQGGDPIATAATSRTRSLTIVSLYFQVLRVFKRLMERFFIAPRNFFLIAHIHMRPDWGEVLPWYISADICHCTALVLYVCVFSCELSFNKLLL